MRGQTGAMTAPRQKTPNGTINDGLSAVKKSKLPTEHFTPPNILKAKVGGSGKLDMAALTRAEKAVDNLRGEFSNWIASDVRRLSEAREVYGQKPNRDNLAALYRVAHDLRGQGVSFDAPILGRIAASLCVLAELTESSTGLPMVLVDGHIDAIKNVARLAKDDPELKLAQVLAAELESMVAALLANASKS